MKTVICLKTKEVAKTYRDYLNTRWWKLFKKRFYRKLKSKHLVFCSICRGTSGFNVHHRSYKNLGHENKKDVVLLCQDCHNRLHVRAKEVQITHPNRSLFAITNRCINSTLKRKNSRYNFIR